jgi:hypothetical protein
VNIFLITNTALMQSAAYGNPVTSATLSLLRMIDHHGKLIRCAIYRKAD